MVIHNGWAQVTEWRMAWLECSRRDGFVISQESPRIIRLFAPAAPIVRQKIFLREI